MGMFIVIRRIFSQSELIYSGCGLIIIQMNFGGNQFIVIILQNGKETC